MRKTNVVLAGLLVLTALGVLVIAAPPKKDKPVVCVGVFDSRVVALAWGRSKTFNKELDKMRADYKKAEAAGADVLVSKWEIAYKTKSVKFVDVTSQMAGLFHPDEETAKIMKDMLKIEPIPLDQLEKHDH